MILLPWLLAGSVATAAPAPSPAPGRYGARMCVTVAAQPPSCGPADAQVDAAGEMSLRVHDITYLVSFEQGVLLGIMMHGNMQIGEFLSSYRWTGDTLLFGDGPRGLQYEVQLTPRRGATPPAPVASH
ncbi:MAG: hypothetical protein KF891_13475 [Rhizobacter sp.]|nr:hypothetical protein [Rhizobacter sp.]